MRILFVFVSLWLPLNCQYTFRQTLTYAANLIEFDETGDYAILAENQNINVLEFTGFIYIYAYHVSLLCTITSMNY